MSRSRQSSVGWWPEPKDRWILHQDTVLPHIETGESSNGRRPCASRGGNLDRIAHQIPRGVVVRSIPGSGRFAAGCLQRR